MSTLSELPSYTLIHVPSDSEVPSEQQLKADLENGDVRTKTAALKKTILMILNGEKINNVVSYRNDIVTCVLLIKPSLCSS